MNKNMSKIPVRLSVDSKVSLKTYVDTCVTETCKAKDMTMWPLLSVVTNPLKSKINLIYMFGASGTEVIFTTSDAKVYSIGTNCSGCLGVGDSNNSLEPRQIEELSGLKVISIAAGSGPHVLLLTEDGDVYSWGHNSYMQLGNGSSSAVYKPSLLSRSICRKIKQIACGSHHSMILSVDGEVYSWGYNNCGQIGSGTTTNQGTPRKITACIGSKVIIHISCGQTTSMAVTETGEVYSWGFNGNGQLGVGNNVNQTNPCRLAALQGIIITTVVCGYAHALALSDDGQLFGWGANSYGQLGSGNKANAVNPIPVATSIGRVVRVAATHYSHASAAQNPNGQVWMWGHLRNQSTPDPKLTHFTNLNCVFANFSYPQVTWMPMTLCSSEDKNLHQSVASSFNDESTADLKILVDGKTVYVHKALLKIRCDYFRRMFQTHWDENTQDTVEITGYSYPVVFSFLRWLYTDHVELPAEDAIGLLDLATSYCENDLKQQCQQLFRDSINEDNAALLFAAAIKYQAEDLKEFCFRFCMNHMTKIVQTESFQVLDKDVMYDFIVEAAKKGAFKR